MTPMERSGTLSGVVKSYLSGRTPSVITTILIVCDVRLVRDLCSSLLGSQAGLAVISTSIDRNEAVRDIRMRRPDLVFLDTDLPGFDAVVRAAGECNARVVVYGGTDSTIADQNAKAVVVLGKSASTSEVVQAVRALGQPDPRRVAGAPALTTREREVLALIARSYTNKQIATTLVISLPTVKSHVHNILAKLGAECRTDAGRLVAPRDALDRGISIAKIAMPGR
jgi:DNA-binding NarL/FixJ family response regulator